MELQQRNLSCPLGPCPEGYIELIGHEEVTINSGREVEVKLGDEAFKAEVPEGHTWKVNFSICIIEH